MHTALDISSGPRFAVLSTSPRKMALSALACDVAVDLLIASGNRVDHVDTRLLPATPAGLEKEMGYVAPPSIVDAAAVLAASGAVVIGGSIQKNQISGWTRNWLELFRVELNDKPVLPIAAAGSARAHLAAIHWQADLFAAFGMRPVAPVVVTPDLDPAERTRRMVDAIAAVCSLAGVPA